jgi:nitric oxide reductase subunit C
VLLYRRGGHEVASSASCARSPIDTNRAQVHFFASTVRGARGLQIDDPQFWRAGAISIVIVMTIVLAMLTVDSLKAIYTGGSHVPLYSVINQKIDYKFDGVRGIDIPTIGDKEALFGREHSEQEAAALIRKGKLVIQSRACIDCHTFFGIGAYYAPDLTKAWLDPAWENWKAITAAGSREEAMVRFLMEPERYRMWTRAMPNLDLTRDEAEAVVAYLKWMAAVDTNGFPANFGRVSAMR